MLTYFVDSILLLYLLLCCFWVVDDVAALLFSQLLTYHCSLLVQCALPAQFCVIGISKNVFLHHFFLFFNGQTITHLSNKYLLFRPFFSVCVWAVFFSSSSDSHIFIVFVHLVKNDLFSISIILTKQSPGPVWQAQTEYRRLCIALAVWFVFI